MNSKSLGSVLIAFSIDIFLTAQEIEQVKV